jgi:replication initiation protein RepC
MQTLQAVTHQQLKSLGGGRIASDALRHAQRITDDFCGLEEGADRYGLLLLAKRAGKLAGFSPRMLTLMEYYLAFTRDCDWEQGSRPVVYQSLARTALDLGVTERQVQKLEAALFAAGAITWNDSGNHKRYGQRCNETGRIVYAFGVDLTPLAYLRPKLEEVLAEKRRHDDAWMAAKREASWLRRQVRALLAEWTQREEGASLSMIDGFAAQYDAVAVPIRTSMDLGSLKSLVAEHQSLHSAILAAMGVGNPSVEEGPQRPSIAKETAKGSSRGEPPVAHYKYPTHAFKEPCSRSDAGFQESVRRSSEENASSPAMAQPSSGLEHVTLSMVLGATSDRLSAQLPKDPGWGDLVEAAYRLRSELGVSQQSWGEACGVLGRSGAAVAILVTDRAALRDDNPARAPAAYFRGLVRRAERGELRLHSTLFGLLGRSERRGQT